MEVNMLLDEIARKLDLVKEKLELKRAKKQKSVTYDENIRRECLKVTNQMIKAMLDARKRGEITDEILDYRDTLAEVHSVFAAYLMGTGSLVLDKEADDGVDYTLDNVKQNLDIKKMLEAGVDTRTMFYPIFEDEQDFDILDDLLRMSVNCLSRGVTMFPVNFVGMTREESGYPDLNPVYIYSDGYFNEVFDFTFSAGELATIYTIWQSSDIIAMLIRSDADFMVRTNDNPNGMHAFAAAFQPNLINKITLKADTNQTKEWKQQIINAYKGAYENQYNMLSQEQRNGIADVMRNCLDQNRPEAKNIADEDKIMINDALQEMLGSAQKTDGLEK